MVIGCLPQFVPLIKERIKTFTVRRERKDGYRPTPDKTLAHLYENVRQPNMKLIIDPPPVIKFVYSISIGPWAIISEYFVGKYDIGGWTLYRDIPRHMKYINDFAKQDGHKDFYEMLRFFKVDRDNIFKGFIMGW
jgi:hypothetical protein